jgi:hypothetical protein
MRLIQVSRQTFVSIDLPGRELGSAPLQLALADFFGLAGTQFVVLIPPYLASFGEPSPKSHTGAEGTRDQPPPLGKDLALDEAHDFASTNHSGFSAKLCVRDWP